jgi:hypothetical protein
MFKSFQVTAVLIFATSMLNPLAATSANAQKSVLTKSIDEPGRTPYTQTVTPSCDIALLFCNANFNAVPAGFRLVVTHASLFYSARPTLNYSLIGGAASDVFLYLPTTTPIYDSGSSRTYIVSTPVTYYVDAGRSPQIEVYNGLYVSATLSGYLVTLE